MKKTVTLLLLACLLAACTDSIEKEAQTHFLLATQAYQKGAYEVARSEVDSIRLLYPKAIQTRKQALQLRLQIDLAEGQQAVAEADLIIQKKNDLVERLKGKMVLEPQHGTVGNYVSPAQTVDKIAHNMLRAHVTEQGLLTITSIYCGKIGHRSIKVTAADGKSVQTTSSTAHFMSESHGKELEENVFSNDHETGVCAFISEHAGQEIKLTFIAPRESKTVVMLPEDVRAIASIYDLYSQMTVLNEARVRYADACQKVKFIHSKLEGNSAAEEE
ncbi:MAG: hypothetical protein HUJ99_05925 [Bacteroidaceae bacterium]|nr:hypothetical protein [Bacteroidaceae bacterium]